MKIKKFETLSNGLCRITPNEGAVFYVRKEYLSSISFDEIYAGVEFNEDQTSELLDAGFAALAELKAVSYLARSEQCRFKLTNKLIQKGFEKKYIDQCLDFLESMNLLSDSRYAAAWLNTRKTNHYEGSTKLRAELSARGISREVSAKALDEFFLQNPEEELCQKAYEKLSRSKSGDKLISSLLKAGFSYKLVKQILPAD